MPRGELPLQAFKHGLGTVIGTQAASWFELAGESNLALLSSRYAIAALKFICLPCDYRAVYCDTFVTNNSCTKRENVGRH
jgi:hypothetical protein